MQLQYFIRSNANALQSLVPRLAVQEPELSTFDELWKLYHFHHLDCPQLLLNGRRFLGVVWPSQYCRPLRTCCHYLELRVVFPAYCTDDANTVALSLLNSTGRLGGAMYGLGLEFYLYRRPERGMSAPAP